MAIARAMAMSPKILFADEPTGNLDSATAKQIAGLLKEINASGTTVIVATHDKGVLDFLKPRILQLEAGELIFYETPIKSHFQAYIQIPFSILAAILVLSLTFFLSSAFIMILAGSYSVAQYFATRPASDRFSKRFRR